MWATPSTRARSGSIHSAGSGRRMSNTSTASITSTTPLLAGGSRRGRARSASPPGRPRRGPGRTAAARSSNRRPTRAAGRIGAGSSTRRSSPTTRGSATSSMAVSSAASRRDAYRPMACTPILPARCGSRAQTGTKRRRSSSTETTTSCSPRRASAATAPSRDTACSPGAPRTSSGRTRIARGCRCSPVRSAARPS